MISQLLQQNRSRLQQFPSKERVQQFIEDLFAFLFSGVGQGQTEGLHGQYEKLYHELCILLFCDGKSKESSPSHASHFFDALEDIYTQLLEDAAALLQNDPAARSIEEVTVAYPGFFSTYVYRVAHQLWGQGHPLVARVFSEYAHSKTGIDIHPAARIGRAFAIDHGTGVVIGETTEIGDGVKIYQGVTLGALNVSKDKALVKRHPTIEDGVVVYAGATILGGETVVGEGSIIGGNVWLTNSVPPHSIVYHKSEVHVRDKRPFPEPVNFVI